MTKDEIEKLFTELHIDDSHNVWEDAIDNWYSVEAYRVQTGKLPEPNAKDTIEILIAFLRNKDLHFKLLKENGSTFGSIYLSAKRFLRRHLKPNTEQEGE